MFITSSIIAVVTLYVAANTNCNTFDNNLSLDKIK